MTAICFMLAVIIILIVLMMVDGKRVKADTWYTLKEGEFVIADDDEC